MRVVIMATLLLAACGQTTEESAAPPMPAEQSADGWETQLADMLPYIDACIAHTPETRWVSFAGATDGGTVSVRLLGDGGGFDCVAPAGNPNATRSMARAEALEIAGEGSAIFVRGPGENPGGECYQADEVRSASGELLGWWADPHGC